MSVRYVAFPPDGRVTELNEDRAGFVALRANSPQWTNTLDVTPQPVAVHVHNAFGINTWWRQASTPLRGFPCHACANGEARWVTCSVCAGSRRFYTVAWR